MGFDETSEGDSVVTRSRFGEGEGHGLEGVGRFIGDGFVRSKVSFMC